MAPKLRIRVAIVLATLLCSATASALAQSSELDAIGTGELLWKSPRGWETLPTAEIAVEAHVTGVICRGIVRQRFANPTGDVIDAIYAFPLPEGAAVHHMELVVGDRRIVSEIREREEAKQTYEAARAGGRKAALVDQLRPNLFVTSAANINPGESVEVRLEYYEDVRYADGVFELAFPLTYTPRFDPATHGRGTAGGAAHPPDEAPDAVAPAVDAPFVDALHPSSPRATLSLVLTPGFDIEAPASPTHALDVQREGAVWTVRPARGVIPADRDFRVRWRPARGDAIQAAVLTEERDGERFAMALLVPPAPGSDAALGLPTETLFVVDVSGSMAGPSIRKAREALLAALDRLRPEDRFNVLAFDDTITTFSDTFEQAEGPALVEARAWVARLETGGGTMIYPALMRAVELAGASRGTRAQRIVFLTDGAVSNEQEVLRGLAERLGQVRLHTLGIGHAPNGWLLRKMAAMGRGLCEFIAAGDSADNRIDAFFGRLERPLLADLELRWSGVDVAESYPAVPPDLHAGEPLMVSARLDGPVEGGRLELRGSGRDGWVELDATVPEAAADSSGVALHWARAKVESLLDSLHEGANPADVRAEVIDVALGHGLVTPYTSLVAVERAATAEGPAREHRLAAALPRGGSDMPLLLAIGLALAAGGTTLLVGSRLLREG